MLNSPDGRELLEIARREEIKLADSANRGKRHYVTLLINRAREIAERDAAQGPDSRQRELKRLKRFYALAAGAGNPQKIQHELHTLNVRLAADLRARRLDRTQQAGVVDLLDAQVRARLAITNPKVMDSVDNHE